MRRALGLLTAVALYGTSLVGQSAPQPSTMTAAFDVADVHVRPRSSNPTPFMSGGVLRGGRYDLRNATMLDLISGAYATEPDLVVGGPNWLGRNRFDIIAKAPNGTPDPTLSLMMQSLLKDRFKLVAHKDTKQVPSFVLTVAAGKPKMKEAVAPPAATTVPTAGPGAPPPPPGSEGPGCRFVQSATPTPVPVQSITCRGVTMEAFGNNLRNYGGGYVTSRVVDQTGLKGAWDFDLKWTARNNVALAGSEGSTLFVALEQQLGLKLAFQPTPGPVLVVDSVNEHPTENPSGVSENLPAPPPAEFDVADVKLSAPDAPPMGRLQPGGRIDVQGFTLKQIMTLAWNINNDELIANTPKWYDTTKYSIVARTSAVGGENNAQIDFDDLRVMLQALLKDRFRLQTHMEDRPVTAYTLVADKPKLQPADAANRTNFINGPAPGAKDPRDTNPILNRLVTIQNMTMTQFAEDLTSIAGGYIKLPVVDATGLTGAYDFTLSFTGINRLQSPTSRGGDPGANMLSASDPNGALSLFDALQRQLGLKLEERKRPMPVLVIDHVDEQPTAN